MLSKFIIKDIFKITGRGLALAGYVEEGEIYIGNLIEFDALGKRRKVEITGIEGIRKENQNDLNTGLLVKCDDEYEIEELLTWKPDDAVGIIQKE